MVQRYEADMRGGVMQHSQGEYVEYEDYDRLKDFTVALVDAIESCQSLLAGYLEPDGPLATETAEELLGILDSQELLALLRGTKKALQ